jgi:hypothetical protein
MHFLKKILFSFTTSFILATGLYYVLWALMPDNRVFGVLYRMYPYHYEHPLAFIAIPCLFYGIIAALLAKRFAGQKTGIQVLLTVLILLLTVLVSSPFGGMLWHYYDMEAGFYPDNWCQKIIVNGTKDGLELGWLIVALSIPYNIIGSIVCFFLTRAGSRL